MINLLPTDYKEYISYARRNVRLVHWASTIGISLLFVLGIIGAGQLYMTQSIANNKEQLRKAEEQLKVQKLEETQRRVEEIGNSLKLVVQVLSKEILFSKLLRQIGAAMPSDTVLTNLSINKLEGGIDLQIAATGYGAATQVQLNLSDPTNKIFDQADIINIKCGQNETSALYPCTASIRAKFSPSNPFLFINATEEN
ncbi:hypothetical protein CR970_00190 [Candidatus Saccharibacteria bacterium]|nr:MAG: hypothetical protein CR970_00190 [Candidatus Saccharibacteria bacterium]